jgi:erythromycin esterase
MTDDPGGFSEDHEVHGNFADRELLRQSLSETIDPLHSVAPDANFEDLDALGEAIGDANVIGMGEASHGTREFFQFKHRLFQYLAEEHGVRLLGLEANFAAMLDVNEYVVRGKGSAEETLSNEYIHESYRTESLLDLVEWMREFNEGRERDDRIRFHGFDVQYPLVAAAKLESYFETVDPDVLPPVRDDLAHLASNGFPDVTDDEELRAHLDAREAVVSTLGEALDANEAEYVEETSRKAYERADRLAWTIEQGRKQFEAIYQGRTDTGANVRIRDSAMAAQVQWLLRHEGCDRIALWGHNAHLTRGAFGGGTVRHKQGIPSLGKNLAMLRNVDYCALGLILGGGTVGAVYVPEGEFRAYEIEDPPEGSVPDVFGRVDLPRFFLDLTAVPSDSVLDEWLNTRPRHFDIVGGYEESPVELVESDFRTQFDGVLFVEGTTASRPLATED